jgi:hypothetical protein
MRRALARIHRHVWIPSDGRLVVADLLGARVDVIQLPVRGVLVYAGVRVGALS